MLDERWIVVANRWEAQEGLWPEIVDAELPLESQVVAKSNVDFKSKEEAGAWMNLHDPEDVDDYKMNWVAVA